MPCGVAFDELLDQKLAAESIDSKPAVTVGPAGMATAYGFFFVETARTAVASFSAGHERFAGAVSTASVRVTLAGATSPATPPSSAPVRSVRRHLSKREQRAFDELEALGGNLAGNFTFDELRSVFRSLARRYHPDRHTGCDAQERLRLADQFTRARDAYQVLAGQFTRVN